MSARVTSFATLLTTVLAAPALADHGTPEVILPVSKGVYRLPFTTGTSVRISRDHITHTPHNRIDMVSLNNSNWQNQVVAAGSGWIEYIQDGVNVTCPRVTDDNPNPCNGYSGPSGSCCVRGTPGCNTCSGGGPGCTITCRNNYVFIRHPNGEWSKYTHFQAGSVTALGWSVGDWVQAGQTLGLEGDVGLAGGVHLHFEIARPDAVDFSVPPGGPAYDPLGISPGTCVTCGFPGVPGNPSGNGNRQNRIPVFCQVPFPVVTGATYTANPCNGQCSTATTQLFGTIPDDNVFYRQVTQTAMVSQAGFTVRSGAGASVRAGEKITLGPGFTAETGSFFAASIGACMPTPERAVHLKIMTKQ